MAHNARHVADSYQWRSTLEARFPSVRHRIGEPLRARTRFEQSGALVQKAAVGDIELAVGVSRS